MAAQRREADGRLGAGEVAAKERESPSSNGIARSQQRSAEAKTAATERQIKILDEVLTGILSLPALTFDSLKVTPEHRSFDPGHWELLEPAPDWKGYAPAEPGGMSRLLGGAARYERQTAEAQARFDAAVGEHHRREAQRQRALSAAAAEHERIAMVARTTAATQNATIEACKVAFNAGEPDSVEWFVSQISTPPGIRMASRRSTRSLIGQRTATLWSSSSFHPSRLFRRYARVPVREGTGCHRPASPPGQ